MKKLLITGGAGFIGSNFVRHSLDSMENRKIVNLDALTYAGNPLNFSDFSQEMKERYRFVHKGGVGRS